MSRASKLTPRKVALIKQLRDPKRLGGAASIRATARAVGVDEGTIRGWEKRVKPLQRKLPKRSAASARGGRNTKQRDHSVDDVPPDPERSAAAEADAIVAVPPPPIDSIDALEDVRRRAALLRGLLERLAPAVAKETYSATSFVTLSRYGDELAKLQAQLEPPAKPDPDEEPSTRDAERTLLAKLERLVTIAEGKAAS